MRHYVAIMLAAEPGKWRAFIPDVPEICVESDSFASTRRKVAACLEHYAEARGGDLPLPRSLVEIERDQEWLIGNSVDFSHAIVTIVPWYGGQIAEIRGHG
jgi:hypothetical protein